MLCRSKPFRDKCKGNKGQQTEEQSIFCSVFSIGYSCCSQPSTDPDEWPSVWPHKHCSLSEAKLHPWLAVKKTLLLLLFFRAAAGGTSRPERRDAHRCLIKVQSSRETEDFCGARPELHSPTQGPLSTPRTPLHVLIARQAHTKQTYNIWLHLRGWRRRE